MSNWSAYEKLAGIRQDEIMRDARNAQMSPINLRAVLASRKLLLAVSLPMALAFIASVLAAQLTLY